VRIVDEAGNELPAGGVGEVCIKGPTVMHGYWNQPEATAEVIKDGWFHTGDIGMLDELGFLILLDRAKDIVIRGGENIGCAEVEYAIAEHPSVNEVSVYGIPDPRLGEVPCATIMLKKSVELSETELRAHLADRLAAFKVPARFFFQYEQLPRIATGKIAKKELRKATIEALQLD
jgi:acyl-CoA synthetase (AMP-forming)/AMP-acid ligase II